MKVLIVEDEKLLQKELINQLKIYKDIEVIKCIQTVEESIRWLNENTALADLIFMDIELADGICFEIFESINLVTPIIFLTAYSEYAIQAFKVNSIDYLLKPINPEELSFAINKFRKKLLQEKPVMLALFKRLYSKIKDDNTDRLLIRLGDNYKYININDIAYFIAESKYTTVITFNNLRYIIDDSLSQLETVLHPQKFYRPTRNIIVNIKAVEKASKYFNSRLKLYVSPDNNFNIIISRAKVKGFLKWMGDNTITHTN